LFLRAAKQSPSLTLEGVYREQFDFVFRCAARLGGPGIDPEDVAQEVFLVVRRKLRSFDGSAKLTTWLYAITLNVVRGLRRKARRQALLRLQLWPADEVAADRAEAVEAHRTVYQVLDKLAPKKREVFILADLEGLSCDEIASIVGVKTETVWSRLHYARKEFAAHLDRLQSAAARREGALLDNAGRARALA
jgi:RNA polymerase sigma-70 factor (ECF subfamily)